MIIRHISQVRKKRNEPELNALFVQADKWCQCSILHSSQECHRIFP